MFRNTLTAGFLSLTLMTPVLADHPSTYAGVAGARVLDSGVMVVTGNPAFAREETFEYVQRPDGGITLLNTISAGNGSFRVRARFDLDADWNSLSASGLGLYDGVPVESYMERVGDQVDILVHSLNEGEGDGGGIHLASSAVCDPDCFINMSPSAVAMFVMTRHYDLEKGGVQTFQWAGQDLDKVRTLSGGKANLVYQGEQAVKRAALPEAEPETVTLRHFTFVEELPMPNGGVFKLDFDLWTDLDHWPMGFQVRTPGTASATLGFRKGWDDVRGQVAQ
ncbi:MAG: hypothetical protein RIB43_15825 [Rhodospirillaceae bacterium]